MADGAVFAAPCAKSLAFLIPDAATPHRFQHDGAYGLWHFCDWRRK